MRYFLRTGFIVPLLFLSAVTRADEPKLDKTDLFLAGQARYETFRVPGIVVTNKGTVLVYCEARRGSRSDWADIEILLCRSTNGGKTWAPPQRIADAGKETINNAAAIIDRDSDRIHFLFCRNYHQCFYMFSDDDGATFSEPREITSSFERFREQYDWHVLATGPGHGIQLRNGRLLVPVWLSTETRHHRPSAVSVIYSDDHGETWEAGEIVCAHPDPLINPSETIAAQLSDGRVMLNIRNENRNYRRALSFSEDGATGWSPVRFDEYLYEPICMAAIINYPQEVGGDARTFLFTNPNSESNPKQHGKHDFRYRENVTVRMSRDDCKTWPVSRVLEKGISGYSDLAVGPDGTIYCIYERGGANGMAYEKLTLARFNREWVEGGAGVRD
jgi:sialidase-1